jgi:prepilin-type processing-associated H-X9-DG protein
MPDPKSEPLNYASPLPRGTRVPWWRRLPPGPTGLVALVLISLLLLPIFLPPRGRGPARVVQCMSNLRVIYAAIQIYADKNNGLLPPNLGATLEAGSLYADVFVCPGSTDTRATGPTTRALALDLANPGHCSYVLASSLPQKRNALTRSHVLAYEPLKNHRTRLTAYTNVLFGDGHVERVPQAEMDRIVAELKSGFNPPRKP